MFAYCIELSAINSELVLFPTGAFYLEACYIELNRTI